MLAQLLFLVSAGYASADRLPQLPGVAEAAAEGVSGEAGDLGGSVATAEVSPLQRVRLLDLYELTAPAYAAVTGGSGQPHPGLSAAYRPPVNFGGSSML